MRSSNLTNVGADTENKNSTKRVRRKTDDDTEANIMINTKIRFGFASANVAAVASATFLLIGTAAVAQNTQEAQDEVTNASCSYNTTTPIIPDGNIATKDELIAAQKRIKVYQDSLLDFRECLTAQEATLSPEAEDYEAQKAALVVRSDESIDLENKVAAEFNDAIKIYKER